MKRGRKAAIAPHADPEQAFATAELLARVRHEIDSLTEARELTGRRSRDHSTPLFRRAEHFADRARAQHRQIMGEPPALASDRSARPRLITRVSSEARSHSKGVPKNHWQQHQASNGTSIQRPTRWHASPLELRAGLPRRGSRRSHLEYAVILSLVAVGLSAADARRREDSRRDVRGA